MPDKGGRKHYGVIFMFSILFGLIFRIVMEFIENYIQDLDEKDDSDTEHTGILVVQPVTTRARDLAVCTLPAIPSTLQGQPAKTAPTLVVRAKTLAVCTLQETIPALATCALRNVSTIIPQTIKIATPVLGQLLVDIPEAPAAVGGPISIHGLGLHSPAYTPAPQSWLVCLSLTAPLHLRP